MNKIILLISLMFNLNLWAQDQQYVLKGSLDKNVQFTLVWSEYEGKVTGTYEDNFYTKQIPMRGVAGDLGRILLVTLPKENKGVRTISFLGTDLKGTKGSALVPVSVVLRDDTGRPVKTTSIEGNLTGMTQTVLAQKQEEANCQEGFGDLAGFCGVFSGMLTEDADVQNKCNLLSYNNARIILNEQGEIILSLGEVNNVVETPSHKLGRIPANPESTNVDILTRTCRPLTGTSFRGDNCKRLNLIGYFSITNRGKRFSGSYILTDEKTNQTCRYTLSMTQEI
jgi:hypothetical protein